MFEYPNILNESNVFIPLVNEHPALDISVVHSFVNTILILSFEQLKLNASVPAL